jgi:valyl-tRNA synthetase
MEKRYEHKISEAEIRTKWLEEKTYERDADAPQTWSIDTPPPTVSGNLHIGHIFSYTQTDIIARYKRMSGYGVFYPFGFDDNGLPTERYIEKKCNTNAHKIGRSAFIDLCLKETVAVEEQFVDLWQRMGLSADWDSCYSTISESTRKLSQASFIDLVNKGYIYRKYEPALYCTTCRTSVAQAELDDATVPSFFNDIIFKDENGNDLIIATTRPELLPSCVAVLFHPDDARYKHLAGKKARVPVFNMEVPLLADDTVQIDKGTGLVMCCTFGDKTDIVWFKKHNLPYKQSIGYDGKFLEHAGILAGLKVPAARAAILEELKNQQLLLNQKPIEHSVNVHERCKHEIEYVTLAQWFLNILDHKETFVKLAEEINWYPSFMKARYIDWVQHLNWDWCLSRQRYFGIPFPVWHVEGTDKFLMPPVSALPIDPQETAFPGEIPAEYAGKTLTPDTDVMDTWNTSSITPYICYQLLTGKTVESFEDANILSEIPMSMRPQAHDIIRTWAFYTIVKTWMHNKQIPWKNIVISGHVLADSKEKLSKSKEHKAMSPEHLLQEYSADVIRFWTASGNLGHDVAFSDNQLKIGQKLVTKLWNAFRFISEHIAGFDATAQPENFSLVHQWLLHEATQTFATYTQYLEKNEFGLALNTVETFFWQTFCDNYLELVKDQLFNPTQYSEEQVHATRWTLHRVGLRILQMYAPYMPFVTEHIYGLVYQTTYRVSSIHKTRFADEQADFDFASQAKHMQYILDVIGQVRKLKTLHQLSLKTDVQMLTVYVSDSTLIPILKAEEALIKGSTRATHLTLSPETRAGSLLEQVNDAWQAHVSCVAE